MDKFSSRREPLALAGLFVFACVLFLPRLGAQSLWLDESLTAGPALAARSVGNLIAGVLAIDTQPPAAALVLYGVHKIAPATEFFLRLPSFIAVEIGLLLLYACVARLWNPRAALAVVAMGQLSPFLGYYAAEARNYGLWFLTITASFLVFASWVRLLTTGAAPQRVRRVAAAWGAVNGIGLWVHLFHVFLIAGQLACAAVVLFADRARISPRRYVGSALLAQGFAVLLFSPWLLLLATHPLADVSGVGWTREFSWSNPAYYAFSTLFGTSFGPSLRDLHTQRSVEAFAHHPVALVLATAAITATAGLFAAAIRDSWRDRGRRWELVILLVFPLFSLLGPMVYAATMQFPLHPRHLLFVWPLVPLTLGLSWVAGGWRRGVTLAVVGLQVCALWNLLFNGYYAKDDQRAAIHFAEQRSGDAAYVLAEGRVAAYYCTKTRGRDKSFVEFAPDTREVWFLDNREWETPNQGYRWRLEHTLSDGGFIDAGIYRQFRGITLRHWERPNSPATRSTWERHTQ